MSDTHAPFQTSPHVTSAVGERQHGFLQLMNTFVEALRVRGSHGHGRVNAFNASCIRCGKAVWIGIMLCLATLSWVCAGAEPTGATK